MKPMKTFFIFIGLKIVEIAAFLLIPYSVGRLRLHHHIFGFNFLERVVVDIWLGGIFILCILCAVVFIAVGIYFLLIGLVKQNWKWAKRIAGRVGDGTDEGA